MCGRSRVSLAPERVQQLTGVPAERWVDRDRCAKLLTVWQASGVLEWGVGVLGGEEVCAKLIAIEALTYEWHLLAEPSEAGGRGGGRRHLSQNEQQ